MTVLHGLAAPLLLVAVGCARVIPIVATDQPCGSPPLRVHFYDVGQASAALIEFPGEETILVDTGDDPNRPGCGDVCVSKHAHLMEELRRDLGSRAVSLLIVTHQHMDHLGGALDILRSFPVRRFVDNGRDLEVEAVSKIHIELGHQRLPVFVIPNDADELALQLSIRAGAKIRLIAPRTWSASCERDRNQCSISLRVDYCASSLLFTGDAGFEEEGEVNVDGPVILLQVAHHGSDTSTGAEILSKIAPRYAVISAGKEWEGASIAIRARQRLGRSMQCWERRMAEC